MRRAATLIAAGLLGGLVAACGVDQEDEDRAGRSPLPLTQVTTTPDGRTVPTEARRRLPTRPAGVVAIDGERQASLVGPGIETFRSGGAEVRFQVADNGNDRALQRFCRGEIDIADVSRPISLRERQLCRQTGVGEKDSDYIELQVASEAIVMVTRNEFDVGTDCLTLDQLNRIYRDGSDVNLWSQVGGFSTRLVPVGASEGDPDFDFFALRVLDIARNAGTGDLRSDYRGFREDDAQRVFIVENSGRDAEIRERARFRRDVDRVGRRRAIRLRRARFRARDRDRDADARRDARGRNREEASADARSETGVLGFVRFSFYQAFEEQLRPVEIDAGLVEGRQNCIFPSLDTITTAQYPLARRLLLYVSRRSLRRAGTREFVESLLRSSRNLAIRQDFVPLSEPVVAEQLLKLEQAVNPPRTRNPGGTTTAPRGTTTGATTTPGGGTPTTGGDSDTGGGATQPDVEQPVSPADPAEPTQ